MREENGDFHSGAEAWSERREVVQPLFLPTLGPLFVPCLRIDEGDSTENGFSWQVLAAVSNQLGSGRGSV